MRVAQHEGNPGAGAGMTHRRAAAAFALHAAADSSMDQGLDGVESRASVWCAAADPHMRLRESKYSHMARDRFLTLRLSEGAESQAWGRSWQDTEGFDS